MNYRYSLFIFILLSCHVTAQITPEENRKLNYRLVGFSAPEFKNTDSYVLELANGTYLTENEFEKNVFAKQTCGENKIIATLPFFGSNYTWRIIYLKYKSSIHKTPLYHFSTLTEKIVDTAFSRLRIIKNMGKNSDYYVFLDGNRALYDINGQAVWYLPDMDGQMNSGSTVRDLKLTPQCTITFLLGDQTGFAAYEIDYDGNVLWKGPDNGIVNGEHSEMYHHEFTRLSNGHYMVMGTEHANVLLRISSNNDSTLVVGTYKKSKSDTLIKLNPKEFGTIIEYDECGSIVWSYKTSTYFNGSDLIYRKDESGTVNAYPHTNAFFFDEKNNYIYISFKDINRIIKVKYPDGIVTGVFGEKYKKGMKKNKNILFCSQHNCTISSKGFLCVFNNNSCIDGSTPKITMMKESKTKNALLKIWEYQCTNEGMTTEEQKNLTSVSGGSVQELPDHSILACMGNMHSKTFIIDSNKQILWSAIPEVFDKNAKNWGMLTQYRASMINGKGQLERLIWNSKKKQ